MFNYHILLRASYFSRLRKDVYIDGRHNMIQAIDVVTVL